MEFATREENSRPSWQALADGVRPTAQSRDGADPGNFPHGWQYHASDVLEQHEFHNLLGTLRAGISASGDVARLRSCSGPWASTWLCICPTSPGLVFQNFELLVSLRFRLGLSIPRELAQRCEACRQLLDLRGYHRITCTRSARLHTRHKGLIRAWLQIFAEAGAAVPRRNVERMLRDTPVPVPAGDQRRLDMVVSGTGLFRGLPLLCDVFCVSPITGLGRARSGCLTVNGGAVESAARRCRETDYPEVDKSGVAKLCALGVEIFGRWGQETIDIVNGLIQERCVGLPQRIRVASSQRLSRRWWGLLGLATQRIVVQAIFRSASADLPCELSEPFPAPADWIVS